MAFKKSKFFEQKNVKITKRVLALKAMQAYTVEILNSSQPWTIFIQAQKQK